MDVEKIGVKKKLVFLFILIALGLSLVAFVGTLHIREMKKNIDSLYFGSFVPTLELNTILQSYDHEINHSVHRAKNAQISLSQMRAEINTALIKIDKNWASYEAHYKKEDEIEYTDYVSSEIKNTNEYIKLLLAMVMDGDADIKKVNLTNFDTKIEHITQAVNKLVSYEVETAKYERKSFLQTYNQTITKISIILLVITISVLIVSYYVFKSIQKDQTILSVIAAKLKVANKRLENASYIDPLTNLYNRRYFNIVYEKELKRAKRTKSYITFMMLDIDYFKQYNDTYGHLEGDNALKSVASALKETLKRPSDYVFRLGGEEFAVLMIDTPEIQSASMAQNICNVIKLKEIHHSTSKVSKIVTISIGVACCIADDALEDEVMISKADEMLYKAKENGRDRYEITTNITRATTKTSA